MSHTIQRVSTYLLLSTFQCMLTSAILMMPRTCIGHCALNPGLYTKQACAVFSAVSCQNNITDNIMFHGTHMLFVSKSI